MSYKEPAFCDISISTVTIAAKASTKTTALGKAHTSCRPPMAISQDSPARFTVC